MSPDDELNPAEHRLLMHLEEVKAAPVPGVALAPRVVRRARIQAALREPLRAVAAVAGALADTLTGLVAGRRRR